MKRLIKIVALLCCIWLAGSCEKDTEPTWIAPEMQIQVVHKDNIERKSALLNGTIGQNELDISECGFLYSINKTLLESKALDDNDVKRFPVSQTSGSVEAHLEELTPGTNYFYCLYITCGKTTVISPEILQFTTIDNNAPELNKPITVAIDNQSITLKGEVASIGAESIDLCGFCYVEGENGDPTISDKNQAVAKEETENFTTTIEDLNAATTYTIRAYALNNENIIGYGDTIHITTPNAETPLVKTDEGANIQGDYAVVSASITEEGTSAVSECGFCWSSINIAPMIGTSEGSVKTELKEGNAYSAKIEGLKEGTTYHIRAYAKNEKGYGYGKKITITTTSVTEAIIVINNSEGGNITVTPTTARLSCSISSDGNGSISERGFCWSSSNQIPRLEAEGCGSHVLSEDSQSMVLTELTPGTTYWAVAYAKNEKGTAYSDVATFTTLVLSEPELAIPTVPEANITTTGAVLNSSIINTNNSDVTAKGFCWSNKNTEPNLKEDDSEAIEGNNFSLQIKGLTYGSTYYVRAYATNGVGTAYSQTVSFTTANILPPTLNHVAVSNITSTEAVLTSTITSANNGTVSKKGFCWSTTNARPTIGDNKQEIEDKGTTFAFKLTELKNGQIYYVCAFAENEAGINYSEPENFTTVSLELPSLETPGVRSITTSSAKISSALQSNGNSTITEQGFCWNTTGTPELTPETSKTAESDNFACDLTGLEYGKTYYVWAYAKNSVGTGFSPAATFTTNDITVPAVNSVTLSKITTHSATLTSSISSLNNGTLLQKGFCWSSTNSSPTLSDEHQDIISEPINFSHNLTNLTPGTIYYVCAYARNEAGINYGEVSTLNTIEVNAPSLSNLTLDEVGITTATASAQITDKGNLEILEAGFYWSATNNTPGANDGVKSWENPTNNKLTFNMSGLSQNTTYYVRAFARNSEGTTISNTQSFTTKINPVPGDDDMPNPGK